MSMNWREWPVPYHTTPELAEEFAERFEFFNDDVLVSTYHKSGTTLTQQMITCLLLGRHTADTTHIRQRSPFLEFDDSFARNSGRPQPMQAAAQLRRPRVLKTHLPPAYHLRHLSDRSQGPKNVVVMRNLKDVLVSAFQHFTNTEIFAASMPATFAEYWRHELQPNRIAGSHDFFDFNLSWWSFRDHPRVLVLFYEDIVRNKEAQVRRLADFLDVQLTDDLLRDVLEGSSFGGMRKNPNVNMSLSDQNEAFKPGFSFIRKGEVGDWKNHFTVAESEEVGAIISKRLEGTGLQFVYE